MPLAELAIASAFLLGPAAEPIPTMASYELQDDCSTPASDPAYVRHQYRCMGFILGVHNGYRTLHPSGEGPFPYCLPDILEGELRGTVLRFMEGHPAADQLPAADVVFIAFVNAYPCGPLTTER